MKAHPRALEGLRVLDFTHVYQGPVGTQILADYGADVIKVERPGAGDWSRSWGPYVGDVSLPFVNLNRNKRSLTVDMRQEAGKELLRRLVKQSDVLVHNFRKGVMEKLGFGFTDLKALNPRLIYAWSSGWGDAGPYADRGRGGHDMMARAEGGWFVRHKDLEKPIPGGMSIDYPAGLNLMIAILMALYHREHRGEGQMVSTDLLSVAFHGHAWEGAAKLNEERITAPATLGLIESAIDKSFRTADGFIEISPVFSDNALRDISLGLGLGDLTLDPRFASEALQMQNREALNQILQAQLTTQTTAYWIEVLERNRLLCAKINDFKDAMVDPQIAANRMVIAMDHPRVGELKMLGTPMRLHGTPPAYHRPPPDLGQHNREIALELGYSEAEYEQMRSAGVLPTTA